MPENVYLTTKTKRGHEYLYLEGRAWVEGRCRRTWQRYLGPEDQITGQELPRSPERKWVPQILRFLNLVFPRRSLPFPENSTWNRL